MIVYDCKGLPNPARVRIAVAEKGLTGRVTYVQVNVMTGETRQPAFLAKNPAGAVPVLELDDGTTIGESTAITEYLDHLDGNPVLTGRSPLERATIHMMQRRAEAGLLDAAGAYFHHATPGLGPDLEIRQNKDWGERQGQRAVETMRYLDTVLAKNDYLAGAAFSVADITAYAGMSFADAAGIAVPADLTHLRAWRARVAARPSVAG